MKDMYQVTIVRDQDTVKEVREEVFFEEKEQGLAFVGEQVVYAINSNLVIQQYKNTPNEWIFQHPEISYLKSILRIDKVNVKCAVLVEDREYGFRQTHYLKDESGETWIGRQIGEYISKRISKGESLDIRFLIHKNGKTTTAFVNEGRDNNLLITFEAEEL